MSQLERAATALRDRPTAAPAPIEAIERRAGALRRRRRLLEACAIVLAVLLLGTAGLALSAARGGDDDQGVFVGEGSTSPGMFSVATYRLAAPLDGATADELEQTIEARFRWASAGDAVVHVDHSEVTVSASTAIAAYRFDALVTAPGGFTLQIVGGKAPEIGCGSAGGGYGSPQSLWTFGLISRPQCLFVEPPIDLPTPPAVESGGSSSPSGGYQTDLVLTAEASQAFLAAVGSAGCTGGSTGNCYPTTIGVVSGYALLDPEARVLVKARSGDDIVEITIPGFSQYADAGVWAALLTHPLPEGASMARVEPAESPTTTSTPTTTQAAGTYTVSASKLCLISPVDGATLASAASVLHERFAAIGRTVGVTPLDQNDVQPYLGCDSRQALSLGSDYDPADADWVADQAAMVMAGDLRASPSGDRLMPTSASAHATAASTSGRPTLVIGLSSAEIDMVDRVTVLPNGDRTLCSATPNCRIAVTIDGTVPTGDVAISPDRTSLVLTLAVGDEAYAVREAVLLTHPLPAGVSLRT